MTSARASFLPGVICTGVALIFLGIAWPMEFQQHQRLTTYKPIDARVIDSHVAEHSTPKSTEYEPVITYAYTVQGSQFQSNQLWPVAHVDGSKESAADFRAQHPPNSQLTVWYLPRDPASAFVIHKPMPLPQVFALFPLVFFVGGIVMLALRIQAARRPIPPIPVGDGWFKLTEEGTLHAKFRLYVLITLASLLYCGIILGDYVYLNDRQFDGFSTFATALCVIFLLIPLIRAWRYWRLSHDFLDANLFIKQNRIRAGDQFTLRMTQNLLRSMQINDLSLGAVCIRSAMTGSGRTTRDQTNQAWSTWQPVIKDQSFIAGDQVAGEVSLSIPDVAEITNPPGDKSAPYIQWFLALRVTAAGQPKLNARYPIVVEPPTRQT